MSAKRVLAALVLMLPLGMTVARSEEKAAPEKYAGWRSLDEVLYQAAYRGYRLYSEQQHHSAYEHFDATLRATLVTLRGYEAGEKDEKAKRTLRELIVRVTRARDRAAGVRLRPFEKAFVTLAAINDIRNAPKREGGWAEKPSPLVDRIGEETLARIIAEDLPKATRHAQASVSDVNVGGADPWMTAILLNAVGRQKLAIPPGPGQFGVSASFSRAFAKQLCTSLRERGVPEPEIQDFLKLFEGMKLPYTDGSVDDD